MTMDSQKILDAVRKKRCTGTVEITIPRDSRRNMKERDGVLQMRYGHFEIKRLQRLNKNKPLKDSVGVWGVHAKEMHPPKGWSR